MKYLLLLALTTALISPTSSQSETNHFAAEGVFELDLGDSEIPLTPKKEIQMLLQEKLKEKESFK